MKFILSILKNTEKKQETPMDSQFYGQPAPCRPNGSKLAAAAMVTGILAVVLCATFTFYPTFILGGISIVLALLSKGRSRKTGTTARIGIICASIGLVFNCFMLAAGIRMLYTHPEIMEQADQIIEEQYGMTYEELINAILNGSEIPYPGSNPAEEFPIPLP